MSIHGQEIQQQLKKRTNNKDNPLELHSSPLVICINIPLAPAQVWAYARKDTDMLTQYEITHMENLMVRDDYWDDDEEDP